MGLRSDTEGCLCGGIMRWSKYCGVLVCDLCGTHKGLARCFCGWSSTNPGKGREELEAMGEQIDPL